MANENLLEIEAERLAPYAAKSINTKGRKHPEGEHVFRSPYQRDRDRVIHCTAFRRLEYKTQVFVYHEGDHYRTRLTHTIEVAQIARTIARALRLNEDIAEAISLAHDLGHPPFGHTGEDIINRLMKDYGGFEHNGHTLRIVDELEIRYPNFRGLNLTFEVREGIVKHGSDYDKPHDNDDFEPHLAPCLEAQIADLADEIAYNNHDIDDGLSSEMIHLEDIMKVELWRTNYEAVQKELGTDRDFKILKAQTIIRIINALVTDLVDTTRANIEEGGVDSYEKVRLNGRKKPLAAFSPEMRKRNTEMKKFLYKNLYSHNRVLRMASKADMILTGLFEKYIKEPRIIPGHLEEAIELYGKERAVCDYIAGMTDKFAIEEYKKLFDADEKV